MKIKSFCLTIFLLSIFSFARQEKLRCTWTDDPSTTMTIGWEQIGDDEPILYYGEKDFTQAFSNYPNQIHPQHREFYLKMNHSFIKLIHLKPSTYYYFIFKDRDGISPRYRILTAPDKPQKISIVAGGDSRNNRSIRKKANQIVSIIKPLVVLFGGDFTENSTGIQWRDWLDDWQHSIDTNGHITPILPTRGNHEPNNKCLQKIFFPSITNSYSNNYSSHLSQHKYSDQTTNKIHTHYQDLNNKKWRGYEAYTFGGNHLKFYSLNSEIPAGGSQLEWLKQELNSGDSFIFKIAQYHKPMFPHVARKKEQLQQYRLWAPLFYQHRVDLAIECDSHVAKRTWPIRPDKSSASEKGFVRDDQKGTVYIGEGGWGAPLRKPNAIKSWTRDVGQFDQFKWIHVYQKKMEIRTVDINRSNLVGLKKSHRTKKANSFVFPQGISIWKPKNGEVILIPAK